MIAIVNGHSAKDLGIKLKPCPFCGCEAHTWLVDHDNRSLEQVIECSSCYCTMNRFIAYGSSQPLNENKRKELFEQWNTRMGEE